jgi:minor extracellular protease Epr
MRKAQRLVNELPESEEKTKLQERLDNLVDDKATTTLDAQYDKAKEAVEKAEEYKSNTHIKKAQELVDELLESEEKTELQERLDNLKDTTQVVSDTQYEKAKEAVEKAERYRSNSHIRRAQRFINQLPKSEKN